MALHFSETAPGVHTTTLTNPKTDKRHNIAIIESCNAWQLFIDGELAARDLPSFKAAIAEAESKVTVRRTSTMVRAACILVLFSVAGASAIGMTKVLVPMLGDEAAIAAVASDTTPPEIAPGFSRVQPSTAKSKSAEAKPARPKSVERKLKMKPSVPVESIVVTVRDVPKKAIKPKAPAPVVKVSPTQVKPTEAASAPSAPEAPALGLRPIVAPLAKAPAVRPARITANVNPAAPVVIETKPAPTPVEAEAAPVAPDKRNDLLADNETLQPSDVLEPLPIASKDESESVSPPLPVKAPAFAAPLVRSARASITTERLNSILADIEEEAQEPVTRSVAAPAPRRAKVKRPIRTKRSASRNVRRRHRKVSKRHARRVRPARTARAYRPHPPRRMVCFAHSCRFR